MLKRVSIQNFKSLKDVTLDLQKVNLLIGPNNSGKSNFLKALEYMGKELEHISRDPDSNRLGYRRGVFESINIQFKIEPRDQKYSITKYDFYVFECQINSNLTVSRSNWYQDLKQPQVRAYQAGENFFNSESFIANFGHIIVYNPDPNQFKKPVDLESDQNVNEDGSNIVSYLFNLSQNRKKDFIELERNFANCVGDLVSIGTPAIKTENGNKLKLKFFDKNENEYWVEEVSDGVLYFLALLCIISQPDPPKLLLLEEPEKGIHPRRIWEIMKFIFQLAEEKDIQIILTTHNEHVVNAFASIPEAVFVFDKDEEGATHVRNLKRDIIDVSNKKSEENGFDPIDFTSDLGKSWLYGLIGGVPEENI